MAPLPPRSAALAGLHAVFPTHGPLLLRDALDTRVRGPEDLAAITELPVLAEFQKVATGRRGLPMGTVTSLGYHAYLLDGDDVRHGLDSDMGLTIDERVETVRRMADVARLMIDAGLIVLGAIIGPFRNDLQMVRDVFDQAEFLEVFIDTPLEVAERRDPKGLCARSRDGEMQQVAGIDSPYEPSTHPKIRMRTDIEAVDLCVERASKALTEIWAKH